MASADPPLLLIVTVGGLPWHTAALLRDPEAEMLRLDASPFQYQGHRLKLRRRR